MVEERAKNDQCRGHSRQLRTEHAARRGASQWIVRAVPI